MRRRKKKRCSFVNLSRGVVVVGAERVDGEDDFGDVARRVGGGGSIGWRRRLERARNEWRAFHEPHCSLCFARFQKRVVDVVVVVCVAILLGVAGCVAC